MLDQIELITIIINWNIFKIFSLIEKPPVKDFFYIYRFLKITDNFETAVDTENDTYWESTAAGISTLQHAEIPNRNLPTSNKIKVEKTYSEVKGMKRFLLYFTKCILILAKTCNTLCE